MKAELASALLDGRNVAVTYRVGPVSPDTRFETQIVRLDMNQALNINLVGEQRLWSGTHDRETVIDWNSIFCWNLLDGPSIHYTRKEYDDYLVGLYKRQDEDVDSYKIDSREKESVPLDYDDYDSYSDGWPEKGVDADIKCDPDKRTVVTISDGNTTMTVVFGDTL